MAGKDAGRDHDASSLLSFVGTHRAAGRSTDIRDYHVERRIKVALDLIGIVDRGVPFGVAFLVRDVRDVDELRT